VKPFIESNFSMVPPLLFRPAMSELVALTPRAGAYAKTPLLSASLIVAAGPQIHTAEPSGKGTKRSGGR
jgi:hypothetical protein